PEPAVGSEQRVRPDRRRTVESVHRGLHVEEREARRLLAPRGGAREPAQPDRANQAGLLRADHALVNLLPLLIYAAALVAYAWHFSRRSAAVGRSATTLLVAAALAHTFVIGMETMRVGNVPISGATSFISMFVWLLALAYLYTEMTTDERSMGVFILP